MKCFSTFAPFCVHPGTICLHARSLTCLDTLRSCLLLHQQSICPVIVQFLVRSAAVSAPNALLHHEQICIILGHIQQHSHLVQKLLSRVQITGPLGHPSTQCLQPHGHGLTPPTGQWDSLWRNGRGRGVLQGWGCWQRAACLLWRTAHSQGR